MPRLSLNDLAYQAGGVLPSGVLKKALGASLADLGCALCLHRALPVTRPTDWQPGLNMPPEEIDALIELLLTARPGRASGWLTVSFDDGYRDSAEYLRSRATHFPDVEFLFFVCPEKIEHRAGFRWDLAELSLRDGAPRASAMALLDATMDIEKENDRVDLRALAEHPDFQLSTVDELRELRALPNVTIGNHTSLHATAGLAGEETVSEDYRRSSKALGRLFGVERHFAFPFGTPRHHFDVPQVTLLRGLGDFLIWCTEGRPYRLEERRPKAVLPRFPIDGRKSTAELAGLIAARSLKFRLRGTPHSFKLEAP